MKETKVYLNTAEEATKALSEGRKLYCDNPTNISEKAELKLINGLLVMKDYDGEYFLSPGHINIQKSEIYVLEKEPIKLEVGKFYRNRDGEKVVCLLIDSCNDDVLVGILNCDLQYWVKEDGTYLGDEKKDRDIVDYWED